MNVLAIIIGAILAALILIGFHKMKAGKAAKFFAGSLIIAALIYIGFAFSGVLSQTATTDWILVEIGGFIIYFALAYAGVKISNLILAVGWALHIFWDAAFQHGGEISYVPDFYPSLCIGFDLVFAIYIVYRFYIKEKV